MIRVSTESGRWQPFCEQIEKFLAADVVKLAIEGDVVTGYRSPDSPALWIRDHSDILRAGRFFSSDMKSAVTAFANAQSRSGRVFDYVLTTPATWAGERENWERWVRVPVEADVEYRFVKAAFLAWQATGDDEWMIQLLPSLERALIYSTTHPIRFDQATGLVKRPYTIDTWDFDYTAGRHPWLNFQLTDDTFWGVMHGDNSGVYESARLLSTLFAYANNSERAAHWTTVAARIQETANELLFNGRFYRHFHKLSDVSISGVDEDEQLSLSNAMAINRGMATSSIATAILSEYQSRRSRGTSFAEWFSIDPPFPAGIFGEEKLVPGSYVNGGVMPLVGGEIALAAFRNGFEEYGAATLDQYRELILASGETFLWYFPDGTPSSVDTSTSPEAMPTDGWGSSSMLHAFVEGLCGVTDRESCFSNVSLAPRWIAAGESRANVELSYPQSGARFAYAFEHHEPDSRITMSIKSSAPSCTVELQLLVPSGAEVHALVIDGQQVDYQVEKTGTSTYVNAGVSVDQSTDVNLVYR